MNTPVSMKAALAVWAVLAFCASSAARPPKEFPHVAAAAEAMAAVLPENGARLLPPYRDRAAWAALATARGIDVPVAVRRAERQLKEPMPPFPLEAFYDFTRNGDRYRFQSANNARWNRLHTLAQAELLEGKGRFLPAFSETLAALCSDPTWVLSAHDGGRHNVEGRRVTVDLASSLYGWQVAELTACFGDALPEAVRTQAVEAVRTRVLEPYLRMARTGEYNNWWALSDANWNPVCHAGVIGAALALPGVTQEERALIAGSARVFVRRFLGGFTPDGWTGEGVGYWGYGFGRFALLAETVRRATGGKEDWLLWPKVRGPAMGTPMSRLCGEIYPVVADCNMEVRADPKLTGWLGARLGFATQGRPSVQGRLDFPESFLFDPAALSEPEDAAQETLPPRTWYPDAQILIGRTPRLCFMAMGGNNGVPHNHNDAGTFMVTVDGVPVVTDLGGEEYTARTFSSRRYESELLNSYGHPVPRPADTLQTAGGASSAKILAAEFSDARDRLLLDLAPAYRATPGLKTLTREFLWEPSGDAARLTVADGFAFAEPQTFETALTTWGTCERIAPDTLVFSFEGKQLGVTVAASAPWSQVEATVKGKPMGKKWQARTPRRYAVRLDAPAQEGSVTFRFRALP